MSDLSAPMSDVAGTARPMRANTVAAAMLLALVFASVCGAGLTVLWLAGAEFERAHRATAEETARAVNAQLSAEFAETESRVKLLARVAAHVAEVGDRVDALDAAQWTASERRQRVERVFDELKVEYPAYTHVGLLVLQLSPAAEVRDAPFGTYPGGERVHPLLAVELRAAVRAGSPRATLVALPDGSRYAVAGARVGKAESGEVIGVAVAKDVSGLLRRVVEHLPVGWAVDITWNDAQVFTTAPRTADAHAEVGAATMDKAATRPGFVTTVSLPLRNGDLTIDVRSDGRVTARARDAIADMFYVILGALLFGLIWAGVTARTLVVPWLQLAARIRSEGTLDGLSRRGSREFRALVEHLQQRFAAYSQVVSSLDEVKDRLARRELYLATVLEGVPAGIVHVDADGKVLEMSARAEDLLGLYTRETSLRDVIAALGLSGDGLVALRHVPEETTSTRGTELSLKLMRYVSPDGPFHVLAVSDVAERKAAERNAAAQEAFLNGIIEHLPLMLTIKTAADGRYVRVNRMAEEIVGLRREEVIGKSDEDFFPPAMMEEMRRLDAAALASDEQKHDHVVMNRRGEKLIIRVKRVALRGPDGRPTHIVNLSEDVTAEQELKQSQQRNEALLEAVFEHVPLVMLVQEAGTFKYLRANKATEKTLGVRRAMFLGHVPGDVMAERQAAERIAELQRFVELPDRTLQVERPAAAAGETRHLQTTLVKIVDRADAVTHVLTIVNDVTEMRLAYIEVERAREAAERANRAKSAFLATMSHEIRTPMNGIVGTTELLARTELTESQRRLAKIAHDSAYSLLRVINDILDFSKIEADKLELENAPFPLDQTIEAAVETLWADATHKGVAVHCAVREDTPRQVIGDSMRLRQVLLNLLGNAIKFRDGAKRSPEVRVTCAPSEKRGWFRIVVGDNGIGMTEEQVERVFEPFVQADASTTRNFGGTGLGLAISRRLVNAMLGELTVESRTGVGSEFVIEVPLDVPEARVVAPLLSGVTVHLDRAAPQYDLLARYLMREDAEVVAASTRASVAGAQDVRGEEGEDSPVLVLHDSDAADATIERTRAVSPLARIVLLTQREDREVDARSAICVRCCPLSRSRFLEAVCYAAGRASPPVEASVGSEPAGERPRLDIDEAERRGRLVLVAEDNAANQTVIEQQLADLGYACLLADDGIEALDLLESRAFVLLLADCHMPRMDGFTLVDRMRKHSDPRVAHLPVMAITANAFAGEAERCKRAGMDEYLAKPVELRELKKLLKRLIDDDQAPAVDTAALARVVGHDPATQKRVALRVLKALDVASGELDAALGDMEALRRLAHKLKSSARTVGASALGDAFEAMELTGQHIGAHELASLLRRCMRLLAATRASIRAEWAVAEKGQSSAV